MSTVHAFHGDMEEYSIFHRTHTARTTNYHRQTALTCSNRKCIPRKHSLPVVKKADSSCIQYVVMWEERTTGTLLLCVWLYGTSEKLSLSCTFVNSVHHGRATSLPLLSVLSFLHLRWWYTRSSEKVLTRVHTRCYSYLEQMHWQYEPTGHSSIEPASIQNQDRQFHPMESFMARRHIMLVNSDDHGTRMVQPQSKSRTVLEIVMLVVLIGWNKIV